jgi:sugar lactone lactonase YvrE
MTPRLVLSVGDIVGESPVWSSDEQALYWVDIVGSRIHRYAPDNGAHQTWSAPELPTSIGLTKDGGFIVGMRRRVALWRPGGAFATIATPEPDRPNNRLNEGVVGPDGAFWVGTMQDNIAPDGSPLPTTQSSGAIYRVTADGSVSRLTENEFGITNTMIWTDDGRFVTADTFRNALFQYDWDRATGRLSNRRPFASGLDRGVPDGSTRDAAGVIYNARIIGGAALARIAPDGSLLGYLDMPCALPTSCAFGGRDLSTLYVTSARFGMSADDIARAPHEGGLYAVEMPSLGVPAFRFGP